MSRHPIVFFDLDGTLVDSEPGIFNGIRHVFTSLGRPVPDAATLRAWIGPPMRDSFQAAFGDEALVREALGLYRARYDSLGWTELSVYEGIPDQLAALHAQGRRMAVVTSKNERSARLILAAQPFGRYFENIVGASDDGTRRFKPELIAEALRRLDVEPSQCVMVGDRRMDIEGANHHHMHSIGVLWGFGDAEELRAAGAGALCPSPAQLSGLLD